jgi:hypothetical protein
MPITQEICDFFPLHLASNNSYVTDFPLSSVAVTRTKHDVSRNGKRSGGNKYVPFHGHVMQFAHWDVKRR